MLRITLVCSLALLAGCTKLVPVTKEIPVEVRVAVAQPCVAGERPSEPDALRDVVLVDEWNVLSTDQRENLVQAQALARKLYGDRITVATAGCN